MPVNRVTSLKYIPFSLELARNDPPKTVDNYNKKEEGISERNTPPGKTAGNNRLS